MNTNRTRYRLRMVGTISLRHLYLYTLLDESDPLLSNLRLLLVPTCVVHLRKTSPFFVREVNAPFLNRACLRHLLTALDSFSKKAVFEQAIDLYMLMSFSGYSFHNIFFQSYSFGLGSKSRCSFSASTNPLSSNLATVVFSLVRS